MPVDVTAFSAMARTEFLNGKFAADEKPIPARHEPFTTQVPSTTAIEVHTYMSNLPRLREFRGIDAAIGLVDSQYQVANKTYRAGPVYVKQDNLDDDQIGGYLRTVNSLYGRAQKDVGHMALAHLAAGTTNLCFDGTAFFADSHTFGSGDNLDTANFASSDAVTHKVIALITDNPGMKPLLFQDRESLALDDDGDSSDARKKRQYEWWADTRFGLGYGYWWDGYHVTITDTPTVQEVIETLIPQIINGFRTFTLPKGRDSDDALYVHEGWEPASSNFVLLCNLKLAEKLKTAMNNSQYALSGGGTSDNPYKNLATIVPTSALGA